MNVTALLAHPDDELMCAGTLARLVDEGHDVRLLTMFMDGRLGEWEACVKALGIEGDPCDRPVGGIDPWPVDPEDEFAWTRGQVRSLEERLPATDLLIGHRAEDANTSHGHLGRVARTLARKNRCDLWEIDQSLPGGIDPDSPGPNHFVDITAQVGRKWGAIGCYQSQLDRYPGWLAAIDARDRLYGWQLHMTTEPHYAEGFRIVKSVWL